MSETPTEATAAAENALLETGIDPSVIVTTWPIATVHYIRKDQGKVVVYQGGRRNSSYNSGLLDVAASGTILSDGKVDLLLSRFLPPDTGPDFTTYGYPVNVLVTPMGTSSVSCAASARPTSDQRDVAISVRAWNPDGGVPRNRVSFYWRCVVPTQERIG